MNELEHLTAEDLKAADPKYREIHADYLTLVDRFMKLDGDRNLQLQSLVRHLKENSTWLVAPASCNYHNNFPGGLLTHCVNVCKCAMKLRDALMPAYPESSVILTALFHDLGKAGNICDKGSVPRYTMTRHKSGEKKGQPRFKYNKDMLVLPSAMMGAYVMGKFVDLYWDEAQAITGHDGQYIPDNQSMAHEEMPLLCLVHYADYWVGHIIENGYDTAARAAQLSTPR